MVTPDYKVDPHVSSIRGWRQSAEYAPVQFGTETKHFSGDGKCLNHLIKFWESDLMKTEITGHCTLEEALLTNQDQFLKVWIIIFL
jgi:hypothetical protein